MESDELKIKVYMLTDPIGRVIGIGNRYSVPDLTGWIFFDEGYGDKYALARCHYFPEGITDPNGIPIYKDQDGIPVPRSLEEIAADIAEQPPSRPDEVTLLRAQLLSTQDVVASLYEMLTGGFVMK